MSDRRFRHRSISLAFAALAAAALAACATGCTSTDSAKSRTAADAQSPAPSYAPGLTDGSMSGSADRRVLINRIHLTRTGGFGDRTLHVTVTPTGTFQVTHGGGNLPSEVREGQIDEDALRRVEAAFAGWDRLAGEYKRDDEAREDYKIQLKYGGKTVVANEAAPTLPPEFLRAYRVLLYAVGVQ